MPVEFTRYSLATKAVGIGEEHNDPAGRTVIDTWIRAGIVTDLVLELGTPWEEEGVNGTEYSQLIGILDNKWKNPYSFAKLIKLASENGVRLHAWDDYGPYNNNCEFRNGNVATKFKEHFGGGRFAVTKAPGCVLLFGHAHFGESSTALNRLLLGLYWSKVVG